MTTANKLTLSRMALIPIMIVFVSIQSLSNQLLFFDMSVAQFVFAVLFVLAAFTDFLDGYIARKYHQVTSFGKFLDPIADKLLVVVALLYLMQIMPNRVPLWTVSIVIFREFLVTGIRLLAIEKGILIVASPFGKIKTASTMVALILLLFNDFGLSPSMGNILYYFAIAMTLISGLDYFIKNKKSILETL